MSKRKAIYILRRVALPDLEVTGSLTFTSSPTLSDKGRRELIGNVLKRLTRAGFEASPKQKEVRR